MRHPDVPSELVPMLVRLTAAAAAHAHGVAPQGAAWMVARLPVPESKAPAEAPRPAAPRRPDRA